MNVQHGLEAVKIQHEMLWDSYLNNRASILADKDKSKKLGDKIIGLIHDIQSVSPEIRSSEDFVLLSSWLEKWQLVLWSSLGIPFEVHHPVPKQPLSHRLPLKPKLSESDIYKWIEEKAYYISKDRKDLFLETLRTSPEALKMIVDQPHRVLELLGGVDCVESKKDWRNAEIHFAKSVLDGVIDFGRELGWESYHYLEEQWYDDVKRLEAYLIWEKRTKEGQERNSILNYNEACEKMQNKLIDESLKGSINDFVDVKNYLQTKYLDLEGCISDIKCRQLAEDKVARLTDTSSGVALSEDDAKKLVYDYLKGFYESIVSAVEGDERSVQMVLDTLEPRRESNRYKIVNCFEIAIPIYFISTDACKKALLR